MPQFELFRETLSTEIKKAKFNGPDYVLIVSPETYREIAGLNDPVNNKKVKLDAKSFVEVVIDYNKTGTYIKAGRKPNG